MTTSSPIPARPVVKATWTAVFRTVTTVFRLVMDDSPGGGSYTIETKATDATGKASWNTFLQIDTSTTDQTATNMTPAVMVAMFDAIYT